MARASKPRIDLLFKKMVNGEPEYKRRTFPDTMAGKYHAQVATSQMRAQGFQLVKKGGVVNAA